MNVKELIELLQTYPQDLPVVIRGTISSELLTPDSIDVEVMSKARRDGWVDVEREGKPTITYLTIFKD